MSCFTSPAPLNRFRLPQQGGHLRPAVPGLSAETVLTIAADPKHLNAHIGITAARRTPGAQPLTHHPPYHMIVPGGGVRIRMQQAMACPIAPGSSSPDASSLASVPTTAPPLQKLPRRPQGPTQLQFLLRQHAHLAEPKALRGPFGAVAQDRVVPLLKVAVRRTRGGARLSVARYTHRVAAIANSRLIAFNENGVTASGTRIIVPTAAPCYKTMTLATDEFIRLLPRPHSAARLPPHPIPYGLFANGNRAANIACARPRSARRAILAQNNQRYPEGHSRSRPAAHVVWRPCPCCGGRMIIIETTPSRAAAPAKNRPTPAPASDQDRYLIDLVTADRQPPRYLHSCGHLVAANALSSSRSARSAPQSHHKCYPSCRPFLPPPRVNPTSALIRSPASVPVQPTHASRRAQNPHSACTVPPAHDRSRISVPWRFLDVRRPIERVAAIVFTSIQKPAQEATSVRYSITSSASASKFGGSSRPIDLAVSLG